MKNIRVFLSENVQLFEDFFLYLAMAAALCTERNNMSHFGRGSHKEQSYQVLLKSAKW